MTEPLAFLTPTFRPDLERCEILVRSLDRFAPQIKHYLIVDGFERKYFRHLESSRTTLLRAEDVIGISQLRVPLRQNFWLHWRTLPMRGWVRQQILKMAATTQLGAEAVVCIDSDVAFVRPFQAEMVREDGKLGLLDVDYVDDMVVEWTARSRRLLGIEGETAKPHGHVGHLITWSSDTMAKLHRRLEEVAGLPWQVAIGRHRTFSEYILYGTFVRECLGYESSPHAPSTRALVRQPWSHNLSSREGLIAFIEQPDPDNVAVMVHSKFGIQTERLRPIFEAAWKMTSNEA